MSWTSPRVDRPDGAIEPLRARAVDRQPLRRDELLDDERPHHDPGVADPARDHRHLERRDEHPLLPEGHPPGVDVRVALRVPELAVAVEAARVPLALGRLERRALVEAELLRLVEDPLRAQRLADVAEDGVDRVLQRGREVDPPERPARVEVVDPLAVGDAVPRVDERRARLPAARGEGGRRGHDLEDRARRIEALGGPVDERRRGPAVRGDRADLGRSRSRRGSGCSSATRPSRAASRSAGRSPSPRRSGGRAARARPAGRAGRASSRPCRRRSARCEGRPAGARRGWRGCPPCR